MSRHAPESTVLALYGDGTPVTVIVRRCHYTFNTVREILRSYEVPLPEFSHLHGSKRDRQKVRLRGIEDLPRYARLSRSDAEVLHDVAVDGTVGATRDY